MARKIDEKKNLAMKNLIINTSIELILEKGFSQFTLSVVAKKINVTKATIYWYFPSKDDLIMNISNKIWFLGVDRFRNLNKDNMSATEKLKKMLYNENELISCILPIKLLLEFHAESNNVKSKIQEGYKLFHKMLADILFEGKQNGEFNYTLSEHDLATFIVSSLDGIAIHSFMLDESTSSINNDHLFILLQSVLHC